MPPLLQTIHRYVGSARREVRGHRVVVVGVVRPGGIVRSEELIGDLEENDRIEVVTLEMVGNREQLSNVRLKVWYFDLAPTGETWPT